MYEYAVIFTASGQKFAILIKAANTPPEALELALAEAKSRNITRYEAVEVINCI